MGIVIHQVQFHTATPSKTSNRMLCLDSSRHVMFPRVRVPSSPRTIWSGWWPGMLRGRSSSHPQETQILEERPPSPLHSKVLQCGHSPELPSQVGRTLSLFPQCFGGLSYRRMFVILFLLVLSVLVRRSPEPLQPVYWEPCLLDLNGHCFRFPPPLWKKNCHFHCGWPLFEDYLLNCPA